MTRPSSKTPLSPREKIAVFLGRLEMKAEDRMVVAFSGGPDSTFLLRTLVGLLGPDRLVAAHFDHELRGDESRGDARFCEAFAQAERVSFQIERADVAKYAKDQKIGTEEAARELRYGFLERIRKETGARFIVTGHTADDLAETVLLRFAKGTKIRGLKGIPQISGAIIRPMLSVSKTEILSELRTSNTAFRTDSSNADVSYERNRVRIRILPELANINPEVRSTLTDFSEYATELDRFLEAAVSGFLWSEDSFGSASFAALDPFLAKETLSRLYCRFNGTGIGLSAGMVQEMYRFATGTPGGKEKSFGKLLLKRAKGRVFFEKKVGR